MQSLRGTAYENIEGKGENTGNHHFFCFPKFLFLPQRLHWRGKMRQKHNLTGIGREKITVRVPQDANHLFKLHDHATCKFKHADKTF